ncbi:Spy/CpxP family protein refolding chaperone [Ideonella livida]|uniref:Spy/CpxP family protein refolding chaperone n=1 Tax=Ideonella livida TaxID=2707176 RepID=A0A7C9PJV5_9BURK|nr:Spy/CpxP family protein refolding chaperone [Ideonella livida]NDY92814.1 Spy/CpxP family protein refolding chaperone [Ideonella livida]
MTNARRFAPSRLMAASAVALASTLWLGQALAQPASAPQGAPAGQPPMACDGAGPMGGPGGHGGRHGGWDRDDREGRDPVARAEKHLGRLKTELKITAAQDKAWQAFSGTVGKQAATLKERQAKAPDRAALAKLTAPERMAQHTEAMKQRVADMEVMNKAVKDLYAALTPEQRTTADKLMDRLHAGHGGRGDRDDRGPRGHHGRG